MVDPVHRLAEVRQHERLVLRRRHELDAAVGEVHRVSPLVEHEQQLLLDVAECLLRRRQLAIGDVLELHLLHELLVARLVHQLEQPPVLRMAELRLIELERRAARVARLEQPLAFGDEHVDELRLLAHEPRDGGVVLEVLRVALVPHGARDDQRRARLVDEHRVDLVDDREHVAALHALLERRHHVVAQVVEAELVVRAVGDVGAIRVLALLRPRLAVVEAADGQAEVAVQVPHPLRVAAGQVRVHRDEMRAATRQRIQVQRQRRDERLAFARRHLGDLAEVELDAAHQLDVVRHHVPLEVTSGHVDRRAHQPSRRLANGGERLGQELVERLGDRAPQLALHAAASHRAPLSSLSSRSRSVGLRRRALLLLELGDAGLELRRALPQDAAELLRLTAQLLFRRARQPLLVRVDRIDDRLEPLLFAFVAGAKERREYALEHAVLYRYSRCSAM